MAEGDGARLDDCNLTFDSDYFTRPIRGRGMVALTSPSHWGVQADGWLLRFEIPGRSWTPVKVAQLDFARVENITAQTDFRRRMVAQWRTTMWPDQRAAFCRLIIDSRHVPQFYDAFNRAKADATRTEARAAEAEHAAERELDADPVGQPLSVSELAAIEELLGPADFDEEPREETSCALQNEGWMLIDEAECRPAWAEYNFDEMDSDIGYTSLCARCIRWILERGELPDGITRVSDDEHTSSTPWSWSPPEAPPAPQTQPLAGPPLPRPMGPAVDLPAPTPSRIRSAPSEPRQT